MDVPYQLELADRCVDVFCNAMPLLKTMQVVVPSRACIPALAALEWDTPHPTPAEQVASPMNRPISYFQETWQYLHLRVLQQPLGYH